MTPLHPDTRSASAAGARLLKLSALVAVTCLARPALAQDAAPPQEQGGEEKNGDGAEPLGLDPMLTIDPTAPNVAALPGGLTPAYGQPAGGLGDWRFDFHGFMTIPLRAGINRRTPSEEGESRTVLHAPPVVPDDRETFSHTSVVPNPYIQLNFSYGNSVVTGNISLLATQPTVSTGFFDPPSQAGINDAFLSIRPKLGSRVNLQLFVGAFQSRYGAMGEYDLGRYGTPLIARIKGVGENTVVTARLARDLTLQVEHGIQGQTNRAPADISPEGWNDFADPNEGTGLINHLHAGLAFHRVVELGGHYIYAWSQDDRATGTLARDGNISILGTDLRFTMGRFGHLYGAVAHTEAQSAMTVGRSIEVLNARGGRGLVENYLGDLSNGNGALTTVGGQYDLSIGRLVSYPVPFSGDGPDIYVSLFGMMTSVKSDDQRLDLLGNPRFDGVTKNKFGVEASYSLLSWFAASARYDRVTPNTEEARYSFAVLSPRLIFRTDWQATDQVVLQYSHWFNGSLTTVRSGYPPREDVTVPPDEDMISLSASMWW